MDGKIQRAISKLKIERAPITMENIGRELGCSKEAVRLICIAQTINLKAIRKRVQRDNFIKKAKAIRADTTKLKLRDIVERTGSAYYAKDRAYYEQALQQAAIPFQQQARESHSKLIRFAFNLEHPNIFTAREIASMAGVPDHRNPHQSLSRRGIPFRTRRSR